MTPKERLKRLESYSVCDNYREKEEDFKEIEKALEVLEILKNYIDFIDCHYTDGYYHEKGHTYIDLLISESDKNYAIIKEWLRNE